MNFSQNVWSHRWCISGEQQTCCSYTGGIHRCILLVRQYLTTNEKLPLMSIDRLAPHACQWRPPHWSMGNSEASRKLFVHRTCRRYLSFAPDYLLDIHSKKDAHGATHHTTTAGTPHRTHVRGRDMSHGKGSAVTALCGGDGGDLRGHFLGVALYALTFTRTLDNTLPVEYRVFGKHRMEKLVSTPIVGHGEERVPGISIRVVQKKYK